MARRNAGSIERQGAIEQVLAIPIETHRLIIRQFEPDDWAGMYEYASDPQVMAYIPEGQFTQAQARAFVAKNVGEHAKEFAVMLKDEGKLIGHMVFHPWFAPRTHEIGWVFHRAHQGKGHATEAALALLDYGFRVLKLHRVIATCQPENPASYRVMIKIGMRREGHFQECIYRGDDQWWDEYFYAVLEKDWFKTEGE